MKLFLRAIKRRALFTCASISLLGNVQTAMAQCVPATQAQVFAVAAGTNVSILPGTLFNADSLTLQPTANFILTNNSFNRNLAPVNAMPNAILARVYTFGSTTNADGSKVKMGDSTSPVKALQRTLAYVQKADADIKACVHAPLSQVEYDFYSNFVYQYGAPTFCKSTIVKALNDGDYVGACNGLLLYKKVGGYDCSTPGNKICHGVWDRQLERHKACMAEALS